MDLISKESKGSLKMKAEEHCFRKDRISLLPDVIICEFLSLLPTEDAVKTSVLSQRWRHVWKYVPVIEISDEMCTVTSERKFRQFVENVLTHNSVHCLKKFSLSCENQCILFPVNKWIDAVFMRDIKTLHLDIDGEVTHAGLGFVELPFNLLAYKKLGNFRRGNLNLESLWLRKSIMLNISPSLYLPSLRTVALHQVSLLDDDSVKNLLAGCPILEELEIDRREDDINTLFVKSSSLKKFKVSTFESNRDIAYIFDAPNLEEIYFSIEVPPQIVGCSLTSIVTANLDFSCMLEAKINDHAQAALMSLRKLSNVKHLYLNLEFFKVVDCCTHLDNLLVFPNLTHLEVHIFCCSWPFMSALLGCSPSLISLVIDKEENSCDVTGFHQGFQTPKSTMVRLESFEFKGVEGHLDEMAIIGYFLMNSPVLKKMSIHHSIACPIEVSKVSRQIFMFPRVSSDLEINFLQRDLGLWSFDPLDLGFGPPSQPQP